MLMPEGREPGHLRGKLTATEGLTHWFVFFVFFPTFQASSSGQSGRGPTSLPGDWLNPEVIPEDRVGDGGPRRPGQVRDHELVSEAPAKGPSLGP